MYISFVLHVVLRTFIYGGASAFVSLLFPQQHFGKLFGITLFLGGLAALLQFPLSALVLTTLGGNFQYFHVGLAVLCLLTVVHPISLFVKARKLERAELNQQQIDESTYVRF